MKFSPFPGELSELRKGDFFIDSNLLNCFTPSIVRKLLPFFQNRKEKFCSFWDILKISKPSRRIELESLVNPSFLHKQDFFFLEPEPAVCHIFEFNSSKCIFQNFLKIFRHRLENLNFFSTLETLQSRLFCWFRTPEMYYNFSSSKITTYHFSKIGKIKLCSFWDLYNRLFRNQVVVSNWSYCPWWIHHSYINVIFVIIFEYQIFQKWHDCFRVYNGNPSIFELGLSTGDNLDSADRNRSPKIFSAFLSNYFDNFKLLVLSPYEIFDFFSRTFET